MNSRSYFSVPNPRSRDPFCPGDFTRVRTCASSGWAAMKASNRNERNGPPLSVTMVTTGSSSPVCSSTSHFLGERMPKHGLVVGQGELDGIDRVVLIPGREHVERVLVLGPVVPATGDPPGPTGGGLELGEVQLPDLVRAGRGVRERGLPALGQLAAFALVSAPAGSGSRRAAAAARSPRTRRGRRGGPSPRSCGAPTPDAPMRACAPAPAPQSGSAGATAPSPIVRRGSWPVSVARSVRACP